MDENWNANALGRKLHFSSNMGEKARCDGIHFGKTGYFVVNGCKPQRDAIGPNFGANWIFRRKTTTRCDWLKLRKKTGYLGEGGSKPKRFSIGHKAEFTQL